MPTSTYTPSPSILVLKLGDPVRGGDAGCARAVSTIYGHWRRGAPVVVVDIAAGATTEELLRRAEQLGLPTREAALDGDHCVAGPAATPPLRVALLGCGVVGGGLLQHLLARPEYSVVGVAVRDRDRHRPELPPALLATPEELLEREADVHVELAGGLEVETWVAAALSRGRHVVTANKALLAERGRELRALAHASGARLLASAAVGGALPALETVARLARQPGVLALRGVLNATSSVVLDALAGGAALPAAIDEARRGGYCEADPTLDLDGSDAAQKLSLLAHEAFGSAPHWRQIPRRGVDAIATCPPQARARWRLVAHATRLHATVGPELLAENDPVLAREPAACTLELTLRDGDTVRLQARGAGRWPTAESVLADLEDLRRERTVGAATVVEVAP